MPVPFGRRSSFILSIITVYGEGAVDLSPSTCFAAYSLLLSAPLYVSRMIVAYVVIKSSYRFQLVPGPGADHDRSIRQGHSIYEPPLNVTLDVLLESC